MDDRLVAVSGLVFRERISGTEFGVIRPVAPAPVLLDDNGQWSVFAEDETGNAFVVAADGRVAFWDHETDVVTILAPTVQAFVDGCGEPSPVELDPDRIQSVWIDPAFARELGMDVPPDGWIMARWKK